MQGDANTAPEPIGDVQTLYDGQLPPDLQVQTLRNVHRLFPTRAVRCGADPSALAPTQRQLTSAQFEAGGQAFDLTDYLALNRVSGLLVLHAGKVALEFYGLGNSAATRWTSMSMAKSISTTLVGAAIHDGLIGSLDDAVTLYVPELRGSAYDGVTLRHLLTMTSGVAWNETYTDPASDRRQMLRAQLAQQRGAILRQMASLPRAHTPGTRFNYSTGETHVVGAVLRSAVGAPVATYLSQRIWQPCGMEADATWWLESPDGLEVAGSGLSARLRDFARFGLFMLSGGVANGQPILPGHWCNTATSDQLPDGHDMPYGYMWWPLPASAHPVHAGAYRAMGIFGQQLYLNPRAQVVIAQFSALPKPMGVWGIPPESFFGAVVEALQR